MKLEHEKNPQNKSPLHSAPPSPKDDTPEMRTPDRPTRGGIRSPKHSGFSEHKEPSVGHEADEQKSATEVDERDKKANDALENQMCPFLLPEPAEFEEEEAPEDDVPATQVHVSPTGSLPEEEQEPPQLTPTEKDESPLPTGRPLPTPLRSEHHERPKVDTQERDGWGGAHLIYGAADDADDASPPAFLAEDGYGDPFAFKDGSERSPQEEVEA